MVNKYPAWQRVKLMTINDNVFKYEKLKQLGIFNKKLEFVMIGCNKLIDDSEGVLKEKELGAYIAHGADLKYEIVNGYSIVFERNKPVEFKCYLNVYKDLFIFDDPISSIGKRQIADVVIHLECVSKEYAEQKANEIERLYALYGIPILLGDKLPMEW
jgi:hypothetical protein